MNLKRKNETLFSIIDAFASGRRMRIDRLIHPFRDGAVRGYSEAYHSSSRLVRMRGRRSISGQTTQRNWNRNGRESGLAGAREVARDARWRVRDETVLHRWMDFR